MARPQAQRRGQLVPQEQQQQQRRRPEQVRQWKLERADGLLDLR
jgi:hypothetical protein